MFLKIIRIVIIIFIVQININAGQMSDDLKAALCSNDIKKVKEYIPNGINAVKMKSEEGYNPLTYAMIYGRSPEILKYLYESGVPIQNEIKTDDMELYLTELIYYSAIGLYDKASYYIAKHKDKINYELLPEKGRENLNAMNLAVKFGHDDIVRLLIRNGAEVGSVLTALAYDRYKIAVYLLNKGADSNEVSDLGRLGNETPLSVAIGKNQFDIFKLLIEKGADINNIDDYKNPLIYAISCGRNEMVKYLIKSGASLDENNNYIYKNRNPLIVAVNTGDINIVKLLLSIENESIINNYKGQALVTAADSGYDDIVKYIINNEPDTVSSDGMSALLTASRNGFINIIKLLISAGVDLNNDTAVNALIIAAKNKHYDIIKILVNNKVPVNKAGYELIECAVEQDRPDMIKLYIKNGFDPNTSSFHQNLPMIVDFIYAEDYEIVDFLLSNGVDVNMKIRDTKSLILFVTNCEKNTIDMLKVFIKHKADLNVTDSEDRNLLEFFIGRRKADVVEFLLKNNIDINYKDNNGMTALMMAVLSDYSNYPNIDVIKLLIKYNADLDVKNNKGKTAVLYAAEGNSTNSLKLLIESGADFNISDNEGNSVLEYMMEFRNQEIMKLLILKGINLNILDKNGNLLLYNAASSMDDDFIKILAGSIDLDLKDKAGDTVLIKSVAIKNIAGYNHEQIIRVLIEYGADLNIQNDEGNTALINAICAENFNIAKVLIESGTKVNIQNNEGNTALINSVLTEDLSITRILIDFGANINVRNNEGKTALMYAVNLKKNKTHMVDILLKSGAEIGIKDNKGKSAYNYALKQRDKEIVNRLKKYMK